jgi:L-alanine-DL-glutamate epimerase-like enolase superfamily enzyme
MRISEVVLDILRCELDRPMADAQVRIPARISTIVRVRTSDGVEGIGEAACFGGAEHTVRAIVQTQLAPLLVGEDPEYIDRLWEKMHQGTIQVGRRGVIFGAISGIDIALWDLLGKICGKPAYTLLGAHAKSLVAYASGGFYMEGKGLEELASEFRHYKDGGYRAVKMKVAGERMEVDIERVRAVRQAIGPDTPLMIDANNMYSPKEAMTMARAVEDLDIYWFEEPVRTDDTEGAAAIRSATTIPIAGYETEVSLDGFRRLITQGTVDFVQPDAIWCGGITEFRRIAALARAWHLRMAAHNFAGAVSGFANLHVSATLPHSPMLEMDQNPNPLRTEIVKSPLAIDSDGLVDLPEAPGLGFELDESAVNRYRIA